MTQNTDQDYIEQIRSGNVNAYAALVTKYQHMIFTLALRMVGNREDAEEVSQDTFVKAYKALDTFKGTSKFSTWLYSFTYNFCVNYVQRNTHKKQEKITVVTDRIKEEDPSEEIDDTSLFELKSEKLVKAMQLIDPNDKMTLLMKYQDDMSIKEMAVVLEIGESAVKMRVKRAKEKVVKAYRKL